MTPLLLAVALLTQPANQAAAKPISIGMVLEATGTVERKAADGKTHSLQPLDRVFAGDEIKTGVNAEALIVLFNDDHRERLKPSSIATLQRDGLQPATARESIASPSKASKLVADELKIKSDGRAAVFLLRGTSDTDKSQPPRVTPIRGSTVVSTRPSLEWAATAGATSYTVELQAAGSNRRIFSQRTAATRCDFPAASDELKRGRSFRWIVQPAGADGLQPTESEFSVTSAADAERLQSASELAKSASLADLMLAAAAFEDCGDYDAALHLFEQLAKLQPKQQAFPVRLAHYYRLGGHAAEAEKALQSAQALGYRPPAD